MSEETWNWYTSQLPSPWPTILAYGVSELMPPPVAWLPMVESKKLYQLVWSRSSMSLHGVVQRFVLVDRRRRELEAVDLVLGDRHVQQVVRSLWHTVHDAGLPVGIGAEPVVDRDECTSPPW